MEKEYLTKLVEVEQRSKSNMKRLDEHDEQIKELSNVYVALTKVDDKVSNVENDVSEMKKDLKDIKEKPSKNWDNLKWIIVTRNCNSSSGFLFRKIRFIGRSERYGKSKKSCKICNKHTSNNKCISSRNKRSRRYNNTLRNTNSTSYCSCKRCYRHLLIRTKSNK